MIREEGADGAGLPTTNIVLAKTEKSAYATIVPDYQHSPDHKHPILTIGIYDYEKIKACPFLRPSKYWETEAYPQLKKCHFVSMRNRN